MNKTPNILRISSGLMIEIKVKDFEELSKYFTGYLITTSSVQGVLSTTSVGRFSVKCFRYNYRHQFISIVNFYLRTILFCIEQRLRSNRIDLVITYDPLRTGILGMVCALILKSRFAPEVNGVYTSPAEYLDDAALFSTKLKKLFYPIIERVVLSRADGIKLLFPTQLKPFEKILKGKTIRWFANSVNMEPFLNLPTNNNQNEILFAGFPFKRKGVDLLISAFKSISKKHPDWRLTILGWFNDPSELTSAIDNHPQIQHHPPVFPKDMPALIEQCSIFVLPSRSEAMGRVLLETMAAGKPRIGSNIDGIPTVINDGVDGLLFESENSIDLADKLEMLMRDPGLRKKLGDAGRERASREFSRVVYFSNLINFYNEVLGNS